MQALISCGANFERKESEPVEAEAVEAVASAWQQDEVEVAECDDANDDDIADFEEIEGPEAIVMQ